MRAITLDFEQEDKPILRFSIKEMNEKFYGKMLDDEPSRKLANEFLDDCITHIETYRKNINSPFNHSK